MSLQAIVIGTSAGGMHALHRILSSLAPGFPVPLLIVQHLSPDFDGGLANTLRDKTGFFIKEAEDKEEIQAGHAYLAPSNYHLLVEPDKTLSLSMDEKENCSRPSIDVLFESAAEVYGKELMGILLTGASSDGALGLRKIQIRGGWTIVQDPDSAEAAFMPRAALALIKPSEVLPLDAIGPYLEKLRG